MKNLKFSIGILSWKGYESLHNSLQSYEKNGLNLLTKSKFIFLNLIKLIELPDTTIILHTRAIMGNIV